jgi:hypothetical protein
MQQTGLRLGTWVPPSPTLICWLCGLGQITELLASVSPGVNMDDKGTLTEGRGFMEAAMSEYNSQMAHKAAEDPCGP